MKLSLPPLNNNNNHYHQYCLNCHSENIHRIFRDARTRYLCTDCEQESSRLLVIDPEITWWTDKETKEYWHESVGVLLINKEKRILFFERLIYPYAFTIPAGHLGVSENPKMAAARELLEETGIKANNLTLFSDEDVVGDKCRRGADNHRWHLYRANIIDSKISIILNDEGVDAVWLSLDQCRKINLVYPVRYFISKYGEKLLAAR
jgi:8-oxo-dGTP pyrophosphatase MutT (NUDIX family)